MIKFGMKLPEIFKQLVKGYRKFTGKEPEGLDLIKIKQESIKRFEDMNKVVDMQGRTLDPSKAITGGTQEGAALRAGIMKATDMKTTAIPDSFQKQVEDKYGITLQGDETVDEIKKIIEDLPKDKKADGGRIGFKKGMDRRTFMKIMGGLTALPLVGKFFKGAEVAAPVAKKAAEAAGGVPPYFFELVNKIKIFGKQKETPSYRERVNEYNYTGKDGIEYELIEELDTGDMFIKKDKMGVGSSGDKTFDVIEDRTEMVYKKGQGDETTRGTPADEYEEYKVEFDADGTAADATDIDEASKMEILKEVKDEAPSIKKAGGGIATMLGE